MRPGPRVLLRYALFQVPALLLVAAAAHLIGGHFGWPPSVRWGIVLLWLVKDAALFPLTWKSYLAGGASPAAGLVGRVATARERIESRGYVLVGGELWRAELTGGCPPVEEGGGVRIVAVSGLTLLVEAADAGSAAAPQSPAPR